MKLFLSVSLLIVLSVCAGGDSDDLGNITVYCGSSRGKLKRKAAARHFARRQVEQMDEIDPLRTAACNNDTDLLQYLLTTDLKEHVNSKGVLGATVLHYAASYASNNAVQCLLDAGAAANVTDPQGTTPLHNAALVGSKDMVDTLIKAGADPAYPDEGYITPLHHGAFSGSVDKVQALLDAGVFVDSQNYYGQTPLDYAVRKNRYDAAELLLRNGADANNKTWENMKTPLHTASSNKYKSIIMLLLNYDADPDALDKVGKKALPNRYRQDSDIAQELDAYYQRKEALKEKRAPDDSEAGPDKIQFYFGSVMGELGDRIEVENPRWMKKNKKRLKEIYDLKRQWNGYSFHIAVKYFDMDLLERLLKTLNGQQFVFPVIEKDGYVRRDKVRHSPLHHAAWYNNVKAIRILTRPNKEYGHVLPKWLNQGDDLGFTPLHVAAQGYSVDAAKELLALGANFNAKTEGGIMPLHIAAYKGNKDMVDLLGERGRLQINAVDHEVGKTALHWAALSGCPDTVRSVLRLGVLGNIRDKKDRTPLHDATHKAIIGDKEKSIIIELLKAGEDPDMKMSWWDLKKDSWYTPVDCKALPSKLREDPDIAAAVQDFYDRRHKRIQREEECARLLSQRLKEILQQVCQEGDGQEETVPEVVETPERQPRRNWWSQLKKRAQYRSGRVKDGEYIPLKDMKD